MIARFALIAASIATLLLAAPAWSADVTKVRVGQHPTFTRIVFELDAPAGYRIARATNADGSTDIVVTLDASAERQALKSGSSLIRGVSVDAGTGRSIARIHLRDAGLPIKEMILREPARIVLDVMGQDVALAKVQQARIAAAAASKRSVKPSELTQTAVAKPKPAAKPAPQAVPAPAPKVMAKAKPAPAAKPQVAKTVPKPAAPEPQVVEKAEPAPVQPESAQAEVPGRDKKAEDAARAAMEARLAAVREAKEQRMREAEAARAAKQAAMAQAEPAAPEAQPEPADSGFPVDPMMAAGIAAGVVLGLVAVVMLRRRRSLPKNLDVMALAEEGAEDDARIPDGGFAMELESNDAPAGAESPQDDVVVGVTGRNEPPLAAPGLFDEAEKGETAMDQQGMDLGMDTTTSQATTQPAVGGSADVSGMLAEFERRIAQLEGRLDEAVEARERLERQVAAQSEELRVQRAAIARTQRALRGMNRSDEDQATEPALRNPSA